jgi:hypothetical protein
MHIYSYTTKKFACSGFSYEVRPIIYLPITWLVHLIGFKIENEWSSWPSSRLGLNYSSGSLLWFHCRARKRDLLYTGRMCHINGYLIDVHAIYSARLVCCVVHGS